MNQMIGVTLSANTGSLLRGFKDAEDAGNRLNLSFANLFGVTRKFNEMAKETGKWLTGIGIGLGATLVKFSYSAAQFETGMRNVNSIVSAGITGTSESEHAFRTMSQAVLDLSKEVPQTAETLSSGLYDIASSGIAAGDQMNVLAVSAKAATAGLSDTSTAARAITGVLNAYGMQAGQASHVSDILFQTVNKGVLTFPELAQGMGEWVSMAATAQVPLSDAAAALATMTLAGIDAAEASTSLARVMQSFISPSETMTSVIQNLGYESGATMLAQLGLKGSVEAVDKAVGGSITSLSDMYGDVRALKGALSLTAAEGRNYAAVQQALTDATQVGGATQRAFEEQSKSTTVAYQELKNQIHAVQIEYGQYLLPVIKAVLGQIGALVGVVDHLPAGFKQMVAVGAAIVSFLATFAGLLLMTRLRAILFTKAVQALNLEQSWAFRGASSLLMVVGNLTARWAQSIPILKGVALAVQGVSMAVKAVTAGLPAVAAFIFLWSDMAAATKSAKAEAEAYAQSVTSGFDTSTREGMIQAINATNKAGREADKARASYDGLSIGAQVLAKALPFVASGLEIAQQKEAALAVQSERLQNILHDMDQAYPILMNSLTTSTGMTESKILALASAMGVDLHTASYDIVYKPGGIIDFRNKLLDGQKNIKTTGSATSNLGTQLELLGTDLGDATDGVLKLSDSQKTLQRAFQEIGGPANAFQQTLQDKQKAVEDWAQNAVDKGKLTQKGYDSVTSNVQLSLGEYVKSLAAANMDTGIYQQDMLVVTKKWGKGTADYIAALGKDGKNLMHLMATDTSTEAMKMQEQITQNIAETGTEGTVKMSAAMEIVKAAASEGMQSTVDAIADKLNIGADTVSSIAVQYGSNLAAGLNPVIVGIGGTAIYIPKNVHGGGVFHQMAEGGYQPPVYPDGIIQWAEPETGGEWYIPRSRAKRGRSTEVLKEVATDFGYKLTKFADGGFWTPESVPKPPVTAPQHGNILGEGTDRVLAELYKKVVDWVKIHAAPAKGGSITGLDPAFLARFNAYNEALGNILKIVSGFRTLAQQTELYARYEAHVPGQAPAARPGYSNHERGLAIDHAPPSNGGMRETASRFHLWYPMGYEPWHVEPVETKTYDYGGYLPKGWTLAWNGTGQPERVVAAHQSGGAMMSFKTTVDLRGAHIVGVDNFEKVIDQKLDERDRKLAAEIRKA